MTIDAIKERDYAVAMPEYDYAFWNAVKRKPHNAKELQKVLRKKEDIFRCRQIPR